MRTWYPTMFAFTVVRHKNKSLQVTVLTFISTSCQYKSPQILHLHFIEMVGEEIPRAKLKRYCFLTCSAFFSACLTE